MGAATHSFFVFGVGKRVRRCLRFTADVHLHANSQPTHKKTAGAGDWDGAPTVV